MRNLTRSPLSMSFMLFFLCASSSLIVRAQQTTNSTPSATSSVEVGVQSEQTPSNASSIASAKLPNSPGTDWANAQSTSQEQGSAAQPQSSSAPSVPASPGDTSEDQKLQRPVGTAAAEAPKVSGITAAQPAGVAIAPAKQRRVRTIVLKVGAVIGAGAAVGTVVALSRATPSKPPGAH